MRVDVFERLLTPAGRTLLDEAAAAPDTESDLALGSRLRRTQDADLVAAAIQQVRLRRKAAAKFGPDAERMYFTSDALEQATRAPVARHRAQRVRRHEIASAVDLGCGIGGDLIALARAGVAADGVDIDPLRARLAAANLAALGLPGSVIEADATGVDHAGVGIAFVDPGRRGARGRTFDPRQSSPDWDFVTTLLHGSAAAKVAPGIDHDLVPAGVEAEWVSDGGDLVEACLWGAPLATARRRATVLPAAATLTESDDPGGAATAPPGRYLYEPDDAVIRAHLVTAVAALVDGRLLDPHIAYVGSDRLVGTPFATAYEVLDELPYREKQLRATLRARDIGPLTIKKRGVDIVPERLVTRLKLRGANPATVVMTRVDGAGRAYLVRRVPPPARWA
ncbi:class I SAM-dependent methyltransferase [Solicola gregarius]|uniref:SAM-dependent methyltransferase n=1 Tax=Solicola gregarius TaxID=2908642 RepID=A0AA46YKC8_9ACTN|nr:class I SAM-dependent methyltransferase [Solicola gregarius]UYM03853.1 SAM-dependent methyltransferase [Solicola gregarius]